MCDVRLVCNWVLVLVRMSHPSAAACQDVPSFVGWAIVCVIVCLVCNWVLVLVRMSHPSAAACQDVPSFVGWPIVCVMYVLCVIGSLCYSQDVPSFGSSLSRCPIFRRVAHCVCDCMSCV